MTNPIPKDITLYILDISQIYEIDASIIAGLVMTESASNPYAMRYEPEWRYVYKTKEFSEKIRCTRNTEIIGQKTSWGLIQIMGTVAREMGFMGWFSELCNPPIGLEFGIKYFSKKMRQYVVLDHAISAYNHGRPWLLKDGTYGNQAYVDKVRGYANNLEVYFK